MKRGESGAGAKTAGGKVRKSGKAKTSAKAKKARVPAKEAPETGGDEAGAVKAKRAKTGRSAKGGKKAKAGKVTTSAQAKTSAKAKKASGPAKKAEGRKARRRAYVRPTIVPHFKTIGNTFGAAPGRRVVRDVDGVDVEELVRRHGSPLFLFSERTMRDRAEEMRKAFVGYPRVCFAWSYKTNHLDAICSLFHQEGWYGEVVSGAEYQMARRLVPGNRIIFNGAYKPADALKVAVDDGALVQIDHFDEIDVLESVAGKKKPPVGIRINMSLYGVSAWHRFGFNLDNEEAMRAVRRIVRGGKLDLVGLHCHIGTYVLKPEAYREATRKLLSFATRVEAEPRRPIAVLNLGGGFPSHSSLNSVYGAAEDVVPPLEEFGQAITSELVGAALKSKPPLLVLESGRALVDDAGTLIATVVGTRRLPGGKRGLVLDAGVNLLYTSTWYKHQVYPTVGIPGSLEPTTLLGPLCMAIDIVRSSIDLPHLERGHRVAIRPVGAYNVTQWMQFSQMRPAVLMIGSDGQVDTIREAEPVAYLKSVERLPERLAPPKVEGTLLPQRATTKKSGKRRKK